MGAYFGIRIVKPAQPEDIMSTVDPYSSLGCLDRAHENLLRLSRRVVENGARGDHVAPEVLIEELARVLAEVSASTLHHPDRPRGFRFTYTACCYCGKVTLHDEMENVAKCRQCAGE